MGFIDLIKSETNVKSKYSVDLVFTLNALCDSLSKCIIHKRAFLKYSFPICQLGTLSVPKR